MINKNIFCVVILLMPFAVSYILRVNAGKNNSYNPINKLKMLVAFMALVAFTSRNDIGVLAIATLSYVPVMYLIDVYVISKIDRAYSKVVVHTQLLYSLTLFVLLSLIIKQFNLEGMLVQCYAMVFLMYVSTTCVIFLNITNKKLEE